MEELFDICDADDQVIGTAPRSVVHARGWLHRAVHIFVFNSQGKLWLQRRSASKDECPLKLTSSASGHLAAGENYEQAALRELEEELGLKAGLAFRVKLPASRETCYEHTVLFETITDDPPVPDPNEILRLESVTLDEVRQRLIDDPDDFSPPLRELLSWRLSRTDNCGNDRAT